MASRWVGQGRSSLVLLALDMAAEENIESDLWKILKTSKQVIYDDDINSAALPKRVRRGGR